MKGAVEEQLSHFWSESFGNIYPKLRRLEERGWVECRHEEQEGRPDRKVYSITDAGMDALKGWIEEPIRPQRPRKELLLRIFFGPFASPGVLPAHVRREGERWGTALEELEAVRSELQPLPGREGEPPEQAYWRVTVDYGIRVFRTLVEWADDAASALEALDRESRA